MNWNCESLERVAHSLPLVKGCDVVRNGALRMVTPFSYPNGDTIDIFLQTDNSRLFSEVSLSDFGHTSLYLRSAQVGLDGTGRKKEIITSILTQLKVNLVNGDLVVDLKNFDGSDMGDAIFRLSQACVRISDFAAHQRLRSENPFRDDVEGFMEASGIPFIADQKVLGRYSNEVKVDFEVFGKVDKSYVCVLSSLSASAAHSTANETFRKWYDLADSDHRRVTVYNSRFTFKPADLARLRDHSTVVAYPVDQEKLRSVLAGIESKQ